MTAHTHDPALAEAVAQTRRMIQSLVEEDCRAWELTDAELAVVVEAALDAARPAIRNKALEEAAKVLEDRLFSRHGYDKHGDVAAIVALMENL